MEQESTKRRKFVTGSPVERFRSFVHFLTIACLLSCIVVLFFSFVSMKRRLDDVENELKKVKGSDDHTVPLDEKGPLTRHKRTINPQITLSDLDKRIITLESRYDINLLSPSIVI